MAILAGDTTRASVSTAILQKGPETAVCQWWKTSDQVAHFVRHWSAGDRAPIVVYMHGIEGHGRWFEETAVELVARGISTYAFDRRGAGASKELRGHIKTFQRFVDDADELLTTVQHLHPGVPVFIVANCWGGKVGLAVAPRVAALRGIVLTSPAVSVQVDVPLSTKLAIGWNYLTGGGRGLFDIPLTPEHFTENPPYLDYIRHDSLRLQQATSSFFVESLRLTRACKTAAQQLRVPMLILQSGRDQIVNLGSIQQWFNSLGSADKTLKIFTTAAHSLDFEPDAAEYQGLLANWILARA